MQFNQVSMFQPRAYYDADGKFMGYVGSQGNIPMVNLYARTGRILTASDTCKPSDRGTLIIGNVASDATMTIPTDADLGLNGDEMCTFVVLNAGAGNFSFVGAAGVSVNTNANYAAGGQWSFSSAIRIGVNTWVNS